MVGAINRAPTTLQSEIHNPKSEIRPAGGGLLTISSFCLIGSATVAAAAGSFMLSSGWQRVMLPGICFALFIVSGISALILFELRRTMKLADGKTHDTSADEISKPPGARASCLQTSEKCEQDAHAPRVFEISSALFFRAFFITVTGITAAVTVTAIPLFFFFPRLPVKNGAPLPSEAVSPYADFIEESETIELGRPGLPQQPEVIVMRVKTDVPVERLTSGLKWRGVSYDYFDGRAWTLRRREQLPISTQGVFYKLEESVMGSGLMRQTFFMEETLTNTVYAAHRAIAISSDTGFLRRDSSDNLFAQYPAQGKTDYIAVSDTIIPDAEKIPDHTPIPGEIRATWLQLPELDPRVVQLADEITRGYRSQYDKAIALETWIGTNYEYASTLPENYEVPEDGDALAAFLFEAREGHCEYFATAMTIMLRVIGIPARMTSGFLAGEYNPVGNSWTVRRKHSHIWTEAWFPPYGWIEFDATPAEDFSADQARASFFANLTDAAGVWWRENVAGYDASRQYSVISGFFTRVNQVEDRAGKFLSFSADRARGVIDLLPQTAPVVKITISIILLIAVSGIFIFRRTALRIARVFLGKKHSPQTSVVYFYAEALVFLKSRGFIPEKSQTPLEFAGSLGSHPASAVLLELTRFYNEVRFGDPNVPFPRDKARALRHSLKTVFD